MVPLALLRLDCTITLGLHLWRRRPGCWRRLHLCRRRLSLRRRHIHLLRRRCRRSLLCRSSWCLSRRMAFAHVG